MSALVRARVPVAAAALAAAVAAAAFGPAWLGLGAVFLAGAVLASVLPRRGLFEPPAPPPADPAVAGDEGARELASSKTELERLNQELEDRVSLRTAALEAANERLRHSEARYRNLFMNSPVAFLEIDYSAISKLMRSAEIASVKDFRELLTRRPEFSRDMIRLITVRDANPAAVALSGAATKGEMIENLENLIPPESLIHAKEVFEAFRKGVPYGNEAKFKTLGGRTRHMMIGLRPMPGHQLTLDRVLVSVLDITELKQGEERQRAAHEQAKAASKAKSDFLANMSHEIRTPITAILGLAELSQRNADPAKTAVHLRMIAESARTLLGIIGDVLDLSRVEAGKLTLEEKAFDLPRTVKRAAEPFQNACAAKGLIMSLSLPDTLPGPLLGDPLRLEQILANLIGNAVKFTGSGSIAVRVSEDAPTWESGRAALLFSVSDTGIGIPPDLTGVIFDSFRQADSSFSKAYQGVGLGLAICRELTALMGGHIWAESRPGHGSTFFFTASFGLAGQAPQPGPAPSEKLPDPPGPIRVLVAEDNPYNRHVFWEFLSSLGHQVLTASDGKQALEILDREAVDLVFMDVQMPNLDGLEAVRRIRAGECGEEAARVPVVALTAYAMRGDRERFLEAGMSGYLPKPVSLDALQTAVAEHAPRPADGREARDGDAPVRLACQPLMGEFAAYVRERAEAAEAHINTGEFDQAARAGHDVKGASMAFGAQRVNALGDRLELAARSGDAGLASRAVRDIYEALSELEGEPSSPDTSAHT